MRNVSERVVEKNQNTHFMFNNFVPNIVQCGNYCTEGKATDDIMIQRMLHAYWITTVADTHSENVIPIALPRQRGLSERASYYETYISRLVTLSSHLCLDIASHSF
jgi:hypothetical protein